jgi:hypothetical protein
MLLSWLFLSLSRGAEYVASRKGKTAPVGFSVLALLACSLVIGHLMTNELERMQREEHVTETRLYDSIDKVSIHTRWPEQPHGANQVSFWSIEHLVGLGRPGNPCLTILQDEFDATASGKPVGEPHACPSSTCVVCAARQVLYARTILAKSMQGYYLARTVQAHRLLMAVAIDDNSPAALRSSFHNAVGTCLAHYVQQRSTFETEYSFSDVHGVPAPIQDTPRRQPVGVVLSAALEHYRQARDAVGPLDRIRASGHFRNNVSDLFYRTLRCAVEQAHHNNAPVDSEIRRFLDSLVTSLDNVDVEEVEPLRKNPLQWIERTESALLSEFGNSNVSELLLTIAQLKCLRFELISAINPSSSDLAPMLIDAADMCGTAVMLGFDAPEFFEHAKYMGICPLLENDDALRRLTSRYKLLGKELPLSSYSECDTVSDKKAKASK